MTSIHERRPTPPPVYYDYERQCWVKDGIVATCGHTMPASGCYACVYHGQPMTRRVLEEGRPSLFFSTHAVVEEG